MSRIRLLALFATLALLATVFAACGGGDDDGGDGGSGGDPQQILDDANFKGVKSGELDLSMHLNATGESAGEVEINLSGPFEQGAKGELPQAEMAVEVSGSADGEDLNFDGGITLLTDRAFLDVEGDAYEVDPTTFGFVKAALEQAEQQGGKEDLTACQEAADGIKFSQFAENLKEEGSADVGGTETTKLSGDFSVGGFIDAMLKLTESPACASQLEAAGSLPQDELEENQKEIVESIKESHAELYVGEDNIVRKAMIEMTIAPEKARGDKVEMEIEATLTGVNEEQSFSAPADAKPLEALFKQFGVNPLELLEATEGEGLEGLLEGLLEGEAPSGGSSSGGSSSGGSGAQAEYTQCLQSAETPADLQKCASLLK